MDTRRPPIAWGWLALVAAVLVCVHALCLAQYGWFRDELYYLSCAHRLAWGYVDQPPLSIALLKLVVAVAGPNLAALRLVAALLVSLAAVMTGLVARQLGGRANAQALAALAMGVAPDSLGTGHFYSMNAIDFVLWPYATLLALGALETPTTRRWIGLGIVLGLGLLNKWSVLWLGAGLAAYLVIARRQLLRTPGPWIAAGLAALFFAPNLWWEARTGWPTLEFMHNARTEKMVALRPLSFLWSQVLDLGPGAAPMWVAGLVASLARPAWRVIGVLYLATLAILLASGSARTEYIALPSLALFGAGAAWWGMRGRVATLVVGALALVLAVPLVPFAIPILPVQEFIAYQAALGQSPATEERHRMGPLPQQYADMFGWPEMADSVARVAERLAPGEMQRAIVVVDNYGEAGALDRFGAGRVPRVACQHNNWYLWGPPAWDGQVALLVRADSADAAREFDHVEVAGKIDHPLAMPYERDLPILIARGFHADLKAAWAQGKHFE